MEKMRMESVDMIERNVDKIAALFPNCITEALDDGKSTPGKKVYKKVVIFDKLRQMLSGEVIDGDEAYEFTWVGKKAAILEANKPIRKTLRPCQDESIDWDSTKNLYIEGDNLEVLKLLQESYLGSVKMIYIDPPYNTGRDFIYNDSFRQHLDEYEEDAGVIDEDGIRMFRNTDANGRFHSDWCSMMYSRLKIARDLLSDEGVIFISIDDNEVDDLKKICTEIFGETNFIGCAGRITKKSNNKGDFWAPNFDYLLTYAKNKDTAVPFLGEANTAAYNLVDEDGPRAGEKYQLVRLYMSSLQNRNPEQRFWIDCPDGSKIIPPGTTFPPERPNLGDGIWRWSRSTYEENIDKIVVKRVKSSNLIDENGNPAKWNVFTKTYLNDVIDKASAKPNSFIEGHINQNASHELNALGIPFDYAKPTSLIKYLMTVARVESDDIVLDFFSGSASTADAVMQMNASDGGQRKFIMVQLPELINEKEAAYKKGYRNICEIGKERIKLAGKKIKEEAGILGEKLDIGYRVFKVDTSNMNDVYYSAGEYSQGMLSLLESNVKSDRTNLDLLFGCLLEWGLPLSMPYSSETIDGCKIHIYNEGDLIACFDENIPDSVIKEIAKRQPLRAVFRDSSFNGSPDKINVGEIFKMLAPDTRVKVI